MFRWLTCLRAARAARRELVERDARDLVTRFGDVAYSVARDRARAARYGGTFDGNRPSGHWTKVKLRIADMTGHVIGLDAATRWLGSDNEGSLVSKFTSQWWPLAFIRRTFDGSARVPRDRGSLRCNARRCNY